jgi:hypothetical protein
MIKKISFFLCIGFLITIFFAQFDPWTHNKIIQFCQKTAIQFLGCNTTFIIESLNFFSPSIVLTNVEMFAMDNTWSWKCKRFEVQSSWIQLVIKGIMDRHIIVEEFECITSVKDGACAIEPHILALTSASIIPIPSDVKSILFKNASLSFCDEQKQGNITAYFNSSSLKIGDRFKTMISIYDGNIQYDNKIYSNDIVADILLLSWNENNKYLYTLNVSGLLQISHMSDQGTCYISGILESGRGRFSLRNAHNSFIIDPIIVTEREIRAYSTIPLRYIMRCCELTDMTESITGTITSSASIQKNDGRIDGYCAVQDVTVAESYICNVGKIIFARREQQWKFNAHIARQNEECKGIGSWNEIDEHGRFYFYNTTPLSTKITPYWRIMPKNFSCHLWFNCNETIGIYHINTNNSITKVSHSLYGGISYKKEDFFSITGLFDNHEFCTKIHTNPFGILNNCSLYDKDHHALIYLQEEKDTKKIQGYILFPFIRHFINTFFHYDVQGEGTILLNGIASLDTASLDFTLHDTTIRLPETYNFVNGLQGHLTYNAHKKLITIDDIHIAFHMGHINCLRATASFNENGQLIFAYIPILLDHCFFNIKKDLFAIVSGNLLFSQKKQESPHILGNIIIDRAQLKENILSHVIQKQLLTSTNIAPASGKPVTCDISIETKSPIRIDTPFLQSNAKIDMHIKNNITEPNVSGSIILQSGNLIFPYKSLSITKGELIFSPEQFLDPEIELMARNKIKNYDISLQVAGSLLNHHIMLNSTPPLSEEQIMTLLLVGSHETSLNNMIPALIVQNLKNLIFTHNQSTFLEKYFAPLLRPFNINVIPSFADHTGRGGLRGMLEININDRWKAILQKNFSLTEDTRIELEFLLSDDITLRGIRDERRDLGGEIEMRWKF